jgi:hypothetical protein
LKEEQENEKHYHTQENKSNTLEDDQGRMGDQPNFKKEKQGVEEDDERDTRCHGKMDFTIYPFETL